MRQIFVFCDGDDFLNAGMLGKCLELLEEQNAPSLSFGFCSVSMDASFAGGGAYQPIRWHWGSKKMFYSGNIWRFIFRRELIVQNAVYFNEKLKYAEDELFIYHVCRYLDFSRHIYVENVVYNYRNNPSSAINKAKDVKLRIHYENMWILAKEYRDCLNLPMSSPMQKNTLYRMKYAVSNILFDALFIKEINPREMLSVLKYEKLYPYGLMPQFLRLGQSLKTTCVNYFKFLFPVSAYYLLVHRILSGKGNNQNKDSI